MIPVIFSSILEAISIIRDGQTHLECMNLRVNLFIAPVGMKARIRALVSLVTGVFQFPRNHHICTNKMNEGIRDSDAACHTANC